MFEPELAVVRYIDGIRSQDIPEEAVRAYYDRVRRTLLECDFGIAPTEFLAGRIRRVGKPSFVHPNGFDAETLARSRLAVRDRRNKRGDGLARIGYATGTRTHQKDFAVAAGAVARVLRERPNSRLVLFKHSQSSLLNVSEFPELADVQHQIEWRDFVPLSDLPSELAQFDVNIAPLEVGNPYCESKSELKYFEAALAGTPTIASPTQPFVSAIHDGKTGLLADTEEDWYLAIRTMVDTPEARQAIAERAFYDALSHYGHEAHVGHMTTLIESLMYTGRAAARAFRRNIGHPARSLNKLPEVPPHRTIFENDKLGTAQVTVVIPLHNYEHFVVETLETIKAQSLDLLDLIVVDDASTDASCEVARQWLIRNQDRFNRVLLVQNAANAKLARTRNVGFAAAETPLVLPVDADNILLAECVDSLLHAIQADDAEFSYSVLQQFGEGDLLMGLKEYNPIFLIRGNYIDAMALIRKSAWAAVGGYDHIENGWEDYDLWLKFAEHGFYGTQVPAGSRDIACMQRQCFARKQSFQSAKSRSSKISRPAIRGRDCCHPS